MKKLIAFVLGILFAGNLCAAALPAGYTELEYIEATGTQYIDTGVVMNDTTGIKIVIDDTSKNSPAANTAAYYIGTMLTGSYMGYFTRNNSAGWTAVWAWNGENVLGYNIQSTHSTVYINYKNDRRYVYNNGIRDFVGVSSLPTLKSGSKSLTLFSIAGNLSYNSAGKIYSVELTEGSEVVHKFVPARNSSGVIGMYDIMDSNSETAFHTNQGSGSFTGGNPVATNCENLFDMSQTPTDEQVNSGVWQRYHVSISTGEGTWTTRHATLTPGTYTIAESSGAPRAYYIYDGTRVTKKTDRTFTLTIPSEVWFFWATPESAADASEIIIKPESCGTCTGTLQTYTSATGTVTQNGTPTPTNPIYPIFYTQGNMILRKVGNYADSYDASTGKITRRVGEWQLTGDETLSINSGMCKVIYPLNPGREKQSGWQSRGVYSHGTLGNASSNNSSVEVDGDFVWFGGNLFSDAETCRQWLKDQFNAGTPVKGWYPLATAVEEDWSATRCETGIKIATTKYNTNAFSSVVTALNNAVDTIKTVVSNTINQATAVANLQSGKQQRPDESCPAGKTCLLVEDMNGDPHWYEIVESYYNPTLPSGYTELAYLESTGTQWINTGVTTANNNSTVTKFEARVAYTSNAGSTRQFIGVYNNYNVAHYCEITSNKYGVNAEGGYYSPTLTANTLYDIIMQVNGSTSTWYNINVNGTDYSKTITQYQNSTMGTFYLFGDSTSSRGFKAANALRIYSAKITVGGTLVRNFIPARRESDGVLGMYDTVNGQFYTNAGTGTFTAGPVVLPDGYTALQYIESTGTQYIDTGVVPTVNTNVKLKAQYTDFYTGSDYWNSIAGSAGGAGPNRFYPLGTTNGSTPNIRQTYGSNQYEQPKDTNIHTVDFNNANKQIIVDGVNVGSTTSGFEPVSGQPSILLFLTWHKTSGKVWPSKARIYTWTVYENGTLIQNLVPAKNSSNVVGMYDTISGTFFTNQGTGTFTAGPVAQ